MMKKRLPTSSDMSSPLAMVAASVAAMFADLGGNHDSSSSSCGEASFATAADHAATSSSSASSSSSSSSSASTSYIPIDPPSSASYAPLGPPSSSSSSKHAGAVSAPAAAKAPRPKRHLCTVCNALFRYVGDLNKHTRTHTGQRPFKCTHVGCEAAFANSSNLTVHMRIHSGDRPVRRSAVLRNAGSRITVLSLRTSHAPCHLIFLYLRCFTFGCSTSLRATSLDADSSSFRPRRAPSTAKKFTQTRPIFNAQNAPNDFQLAGCVTRHHLTTHRTVLARNLRIHVVESAMFASEVWFSSSQCTLFFVLYFVRRIPGCKYS
jgi:hypothetical protein